MKKYVVTLVFQMTQTFEVEADDEGEAENVAYEQSTGGLCHQCQRPYDDSPEIVQVITEEFSRGD